MNKVMKIKVHTLEPHPEYEGKWVANITTEDSDKPSNYWVSHKQMTSLQKNLDRPVLYAAFDTSKRFPRFIWAGSDKLWLTTTFVKDAIQDALDAPKTFEETKTHLESIKTKITAPQAPEREWDDADLPF
jgi:hypothetical protein